MRPAIELVMAVVVLGVVFCAGISYGAHSAKAESLACVSYSKAAATRAIDDLLPHPGEADPVDGDGS